MSNFVGHTFEGLLFLFVGLWWTYHVFRVYIKASDTGQPYRSYLSYHIVIHGKQIPFETIFFKIFCPITSLTIDLFNEHWRFLDDEGNFEHIGALQHIVLRTLFLIHGVSDLLEYYKLPIIKGMKYVTMIVATLCFSVAFYYHSDPGMHKSPLENQLHRLGIYMSTFLGLAVLMEFFNRETIFPQLLRILCALCGGTWYNFIAHVLYVPTPFPGRQQNPAWDQHDERNIHFTVAAFGLNIIFALIFMMMSYAVIVIGSKYRFVDGKLVRRNSEKQYPYVALKGFGNSDSDFPQENDSLIM